ncbi:hypothetical protein Tco_0092364 [Tanacetum coccineum]
MLHLERKLFESLRCLVLVRRDCISSSEFTIYEMRKWYSVWLIKYIVNTDDFMNPLPEGWSIWSIVWSIVLGEREEDSFLMINLSVKVVQYNLISKTLREIYDMRSNEIADDYLHGFILPYHIVVVTCNDFMTPLLEGWSIRSTVWSIVLGEREDDSFLVINLSGKVVEYNLISKNLHDMYDMGSNQVTDDYHNGFILPFAMYNMQAKQVDHKVYEFIPSYASV